MFKPKPHYSGYRKYTAPVLRLGLFSYKPCYNIPMLNIFIITLVGVTFMVGCYIKTRNNRLNSSSPEINASVSAAEKTILFLIALIILLNSLIMGVLYSLETL